MNNKIKIIIDSNYIYDFSTDRIINMVKDYNEFGGTYIPEVVIDELVQKDIDYIEEVNKNRKKSAILSHSITTKNLDDKYIDDLRSHYSKLFYGNVIKLSNIKIGEMYNRALKKRPPFSNDKNASDKGFKDSLIWASILEDQHTDYEEVILLTNDNSFIQNKDILEEEFQEKHNIKISFLRTLNKLSQNDIPKSGSKNIKNADNHQKIIGDFKKLEDFREDLDRILERLTFERVYNGFDEYYEKQRFTLFEKIKINELSIGKILDNLNSLLRNNIMRHNLSPNDFLKVFDEFNLWEEKEDINTQDIIELYDLLYKTDKELGEYSDSMVKAIVDYINVNTFDSKNNPFHTIDDDDLPF